MRRELAIASLGTAALAKMVADLRADLQRPDNDLAHEMKALVADELSLLRESIDRGEPVDLDRLTADVAGIRRALEELQAVKPAAAWTFTVRRDKRTGLIDSISATR